MDTGAKSTVSRHFHIRLTGEEMTESIYHLNEQGEIEPMTEERFEKEDKLQKLVADHPELLSGEQMDPADPRRWILVKREQGIADIEGGNYRWELAHLLIDQDSVPTLVEVKRSSNSQIRREIVGQMLDYASHARRTLEVSDIRRDFEESRAHAGQDPYDALTDLLQSDGELDADEFWQRVETNLRAAHMRLLFVADGIPDELTRVVEFLNEQMPNIEVLAVEIKQFRGGTGRTLVPRVIGRTAVALSNRSGQRRVRNNLGEQTFFASFPDREVQRVAERLLEVARQNGANLNWNPESVTIRVRCAVWDKPVRVASLHIPGAIGWHRAGGFVFGGGDGNRGSRIEDMPPSLQNVMENWANEFAQDEFADVVPHEQLLGYSISHEAAAANIDVLAERLENVLRNLQQLEPMQE